MSMLTEKLALYWAYPFVRYALVVGLWWRCAPPCWG